MNFDKTFLRIGSLVLLPLTPMDAALEITEPIAAHFEEVFSKPQGNARKGGESALPDTAPAASSTTYTLGLDTHWTHSAHFEDSETETETWSAAATVTASFPRANGDHIQLIARHASYYAGEFTPQEVAAGDVNYIHGGSLGVMYVADVHPRWDIFGGAVVSHRTANSSIAENDIIGYGFLGASYMWTPNFTIVVGAAISGEEFAGDSAFPLFMIDWRIAQRHRLLVQDGLYYQYALRDDWKQIVGVSAEFTQFAVPLKDVGEGETRVTDLTFVATRASLNLFYSQSFDNGFSFTVKAGLLDDGVHALYRDSDEILSMPIEETFGFGISAMQRF